MLWLADTAWVMLHALRRSEITEYLDRRRSQGFTAVQIALVDPEGAEDLANAAGVAPFIDDDPARPNDAYFDHAEAVIDLIAAHGMRVGLVPMWGELVTGDDWLGNDRRRLFDADSARAYGRYLGARFGSHPAVLWILGGDRHPVHRGVDHRAVWRALAEGIGSAAASRPLKWDRPDPAWLRLVMTYHASFTDDPPRYSSTDYLADDAWLSLTMLQSGHRADVRSYDQVRADYDRIPVRPVIDGEPNYEDWVHPTVDGDRPHTAWDVRKRAYWAFFAGACGHTFGHTSVWCMVREGQTDARHRYTWQEAMERPGAAAVAPLRRLIQSRPFVDSVPDQDLVVALDNGLDIRVQARRATDRTWAFVYATSGGDVTIDPSQLAAGRLRTAWFDPRTGADAGEALPGEPRIPWSASRGWITFPSPTAGRDNDWVLTVDVAQED